MTNNVINEELLNQEDIDKMFDAICASHNIRLNESDENALNEGVVKWLKGWFKDTLLRGYNEIAKSNNMYHARNLIAKQTIQYVFGRNDKLSKAILRKSQGLFKNETVTEVLANEYYIVSCTMQAFKMLKEGKSKKFNKNFNGTFVGELAKVMFYCHTDFEIIKGYLFTKGNDELNDSESVNEGWLSDVFSSFSKRKQRLNDWGGIFINPNRTFNGTSFKILKVNPDNKYISTQSVNVQGKEVKILGKTTINSMTEQIFEFCKKYGIQTRFDDYITEINSGLRQLSPNNRDIYTLDREIQMVRRFTADKQGSTVYEQIKQGLEVCVELYSKIIEQIITAYKSKNEERVSHYTSAKRKARDVFRIDDPLKTTLMEVKNSVKMFIDVFFKLEPYQQIIRYCDNQFLWVYITSILYNKMNEDGRFDVKTFIDAVNGAGRKFQGTDTDDEDDDIFKDPSDEDEEEYFQDDNDTNNDTTDIIKEFKENVGEDFKSLFQRYYNISIDEMVKNGLVSDDIKLMHIPTRFLIDPILKDTIEDSKFYHDFSYILKATSFEEKIGEEDKERYHFIYFNIPEDNSGLGFFKDKSETANKRNPQLVIAFLYDHFEKRIWNKDNKFSIFAMFGNCLFNELNYTKYGSDNKYILSLQQDVATLENWHTSPGGWEDIKFGYPNREEVLRLIQKEMDYLSTHQKINSNNLEDFSDDDTAENPSQKIDNIFNSNVKIFQ